MTMNDSQPNEDVATLKLELELERLDRQWLEERPRYLSRGREVTIPEAIVCGFLVVVVGIVVIGIGLSVLADAGRPDVTPLGTVAIVAGTLMLGAGVVVGWYYARKAQAYNEAKESYEQRRQQLLREIEASKAKAGGNVDESAG